MSSLTRPTAGVPGRPAGQESAGRARRAWLEDLEHYDEPSPEDAADLDELAAQSVADLILACQLLGATDEGGADEDDEPEAGPPVPMPVPMPVPVPTPAPGPLSGALDQLVLPFAAGARPIARTGRADRSRPGDAPGWKGAPR